MFKHLSWLPVCWLLLVACGPSPGRPATQAEMRRSFERATAVEVQLGQGAKRGESGQRAIDRATAILHLRLGLPTNWTEGIGHQAVRVPRIVVGTPEDPKLVKLLQKFGVQTEGAPSFAGQALRGGRARWELRGEDPDRPGLPIAIYVGVRWRALEDCLDQLSLGGRPGLTMVTLEEGRRELDWKGRVRGPSFVETENWALPPLLESAQLALRAGANVANSRALQYGKRAQLALEHLTTWGVPPSDETLQLFVIEDAGYLHSYAQSSGLAVSLGLQNHAVVLLSKALPHDDGACVAKWSLRTSLGAALDPWLEEGASVDAAGRWWGRDLESWGKQLAAGGLLPSVEQLVDPSRTSSLSQHQLAPGRGLLFRYLRGTRSPQEMRALWDAESNLSVDAPLEQGFREWLAAPNAGTTTRPRTIPEPGSFRTGVALDSNVRLGGGYDGLELEWSLGDAAQSGADSLSITSYFTEGPRPWEAVASTGRQTCEGDVALAQVVAKARRAQLGTIALQPHYLMSDSSGHSAWQRRTSPDHWREFFRGLHPAVIHYALLSELCQVDLLCLGTGLSRRNGNASLSPESHETFTTGWAQAIELARGGFAGPLTYAADWDGEARNFQHWDKLDFVGLSYYPVIQPLGTRAPTTQLLDVRWSGVLTLIDELAATHGKPVLLMEFGARSVAEGANEVSIGSGVADAELQRQYYQTFADNLAQRRADGGSLPNSFGGLFAWKWSPGLSVGGERDRGFYLQGKPAAAVLPTFAPKQ